MGSAPAIHTFMLGKRNLTGSFSPKCQMEILHWQPYSFEYASTIIMRSYTVTHGSALHVGMAQKKMAAPINVLAVIRR